MATLGLALVTACFLGAAAQVGCRGSSPEAVLPDPERVPVSPGPKTGFASADADDGTRDRRDALRDVADRHVRTMNLPEGTWRFQNHADTIQSFTGGRHVLVSRSFLYRRILDGVPVYGPGTSILVTVGPEGTLERVHADWAPAFHRPARVEDFAHLDLDEWISREVKPEDVPKGARLVNLGLCYLSRPVEGGLEAVPVVGVRVLPGDPALKGLGGQFYLPLRP